jgi:hypothetical protein
MFEVEPFNRMFTGKTTIIAVKQFLLVKPSFLPVTPPFSLEHYSYLFKSLACKTTFFAGKTW